MREKIQQAMSVLLAEQIKRFSIEEYLTISEALGHPRTQLLEGIIYTMSPDKPPHSNCLNNLRSVLEEQNAVLKAHGLRAWTQSQLLVEPPLLGYPSLPEPDAALVPRQRYEATHPTSAVFVAEVLSGDEGVDRQVKRHVYAQMRVPEYWLIDPLKETVEVLYLEEGEYRTVAQIALEQDPQAAITLRAVPTTIALAAIFE